MREQEPPGLIAVSAEHSRTVQAIGADIFVTIQGDSLVTGQAALKKAKEVAGLVAALADNGLEEGSVELRGVSATVSSGLLGKSSSASYRLKIHCSKMELVAEALGAITSRKSAELQRVEWVYADDEALLNELLEQCSAKALRKAKKIARALGCQLKGPHTFREDTSAGEPRSWEAQPFGGGMESMGRSKKAPAVTAEDLGLEIKHSKKVTARVQVEFRV